VKSVAKTLFYCFASSHLSGSSQSCEKDKHQKTTKGRTTEIKYEQPVF
jgi:hypothetical protein